MNVRKSFGALIQEIKDFIREDFNKWAYLYAGVYVLALIVFAYGFDGCLRSKKRASYVRVLLFCSFWQAFIRELQCYFRRLYIGHTCLQNQTYMGRGLCAFGYCFYDVNNGIDTSFYQTIIKIEL